METPVTYFYVDKPRSVRVRVGMPKGLLTHWYPAVDTFGPPLSATCKSLPGESYLDWGQVELIPDVQAPSVGPPEPMAGLKPAGPQDTWRFARQTDSAFVRQRNKESKVPLWSIATKDGKVYTGTRTRENATELVLQDGAGNTTVILKKAIQERTVVQNGACARVRPEGEADKFLFYRGLGTFELPLKVTHKQLRIGNNLVLENRSNDTLKGVFALQVDKDSIAFAALDDLAGRQRMLAPLGSTPDRYLQ